MSRKKEFDTGQEGDFITLYHGTNAPAESYRERGIEVGMARADPGKIWATQRRIHSPAGWIGGSGWGAAYKMPDWQRVVEFKVPSTDAVEVHPGTQNYQLTRSVHPDEIVDIHEPHQKYAKRIAKAQELQNQRWKELGFK